MGDASFRRSVATAVMLFLLWGCAGTSVEPMTSCDQTQLSAEEKSQLESLLGRR